MSSAFDAHIFILYMLVAGRPRGLTVRESGTMVPVGFSLFILPTQTSNNDCIVVFTGISLMSSSFFY